MSAFFARFRRVRTAEVGNFFRHLPARLTTNTSSSSTAAGGREKRSSDATRVPAEKDEHDLKAPKEMTKKYIGIEYAGNIFTRLALYW
jgi:hypothetical protein